MDTTPQADPKLKKPRFFAVLGIAIAVDLSLVVLYTLFTAQPSWRLLSDGLCFSSSFLGLLSALPLILDAGRGFGVAIKMSDDEEARKAAVILEHQRRERGMVITFAFVTATILIAILSFVVGAF